MYLSSFEVAFFIIHSPSHFHISSCLLRQLSRFLELPLTRTFFDLPRRFELSGVVCIAALLLFSSRYKLVILIRSSEIGFLLFGTWGSFTTPGCRDMKWNNGCINLVWLLNTVITLFLYIHEKNKMILTWPPNECK